MLLETSTREIGVKARKQENSEFMSLLCPFNAVKVTVKIIIIIINETLNQKKEEVT